MKKLILSAILLISLASSFPSPVKATGTLNHMSVDISQIKADETKYIPYKYYIQNEVRDGEFQGFMYNNKFYIHFDSLNQFPLIKKTVYINENIMNYETQAEIEFIDGSKVSFFNPLNDDPFILNTKEDSISIGSLITEDMAPGRIGHLPLRVVMEQIGYKVNYNAKEHSIIIETR